MKWSPTAAKRVVSGRSNIASQAFVTSFTQKYPVLADRSPVYAELRNLIDLAVAAAYIQKQDFYGKAGWKMEFFGNEQSMPTEMYNAPKQVESTVATVWRGAKLMTPIAGGVRDRGADGHQAGERPGRRERQRGQAPRELKLKLAPGQWWWD